MFTEDDVNVHSLYDYVLKKQFTLRITHYERGKGSSFLQDIAAQQKKINDLHVHTKPPATHFEQTICPR
jgi:hypothetical protein